MAGMPTVLMCADPLNPRRVDPHFAREAAAVRALGGAVARIDHDALRAGDAEGAVRFVPAGSARCRYRGWMVTPGEYAVLDRALRGRGVRLLTSPGRFRAAHELPGWYAAFTPVTAVSVWLPCAADAPPAARELSELAAGLPPGPGVVKDYVKSRKHEWDQACFVPDLTDPVRLSAVVARMVALQGPALTGGVVLRAFERLRGPEVRVWWADGAPVLAGPHPDAPDAPVPCPDLTRVAECVRALGCRFVTTDVALRADGVWRVVEVGDGQVSDLPSGTDPSALHAALTFG